MLFQSIWIENELALQAVRLLVLSEAVGQAVDMVLMLLMRGEYVASIAQ